MSTIGSFSCAMRHRNFISVCLAVILLGSWVRPSFAQEALTKLLVAHAGLISTHASVWLAEEQGFYKRHGVDVTSVFISSGSVTSQALVAGEAKVASTSVGPTAGAVGGGAELVILAGTIHILPYQLWVTPQTRQPADLKGKRVAISTFGSGSHLAAEVALQVLGLDPARDKIAIMQVGTQADRLAALVSGRVDATALEPGFGQPAREKGLTVISDLTKLDALLRINPRMAKLKAADLVDSSFIERLEKSGYIKEAMKRSG